MRLMREKQIFAVPTFTIFEYFADHADTPAHAARERAMLDLHQQEFRKQIAAGVPMAVGSDVGPFPHGTQAREFVLMAKFGMAPLAVLQADLLNGAKLLGFRRSAAGHQCGAECVVRDEGWSRLQEVKEWRE
jgi:imidazolonepropionase-like amidohydrolase